MKDVTIIGLGYIGLPTSVLLASKGFSVNGVDINEKIVKKINEGEVHIVEPDLSILLKKVIRNKLLKASTAPEQANVYLIVVPTPFKGNNQPDISYVKAATQSIIPLLKNDDLVIIESTCPVGTTEKVSSLIFSSRPELKNSIYISYCPERVLPGNILYELVNNDRVIGGLDKISTEKAAEFYSKFVKGSLHKTNCRTAEMCKLVENSSRDVQIAFANELSMICETKKINVWELIDLANKHPRVNILKPGCGVGGHCIAVDPYFIISQNPDESEIISKARYVNQNKTSWCIKKIKEEIEIFKTNERSNPNIGILGLSFKANIDDLRESPALSIATKLSNIYNKDNIFYSEPNIKNHPKFTLTSLKEVIEKVDIICILVAHDQYKNLKIPESKKIIDFCGITNN
tara:strand:+ start:2123 stop:3331 length:1209 start_codon:yes stop_codon:yes gene_type:complete